MEQLSSARPELIGHTRRQFLNRSALGLLGLGLAAFSGSVLAFLWPRLGAGFGSKIRVGTLDDILATVRDTRQPLYVPAGRFYVVPSGAGVEALYQKCPHLGCRVPWCGSSQWFECPCHNSMYNRVGEKKLGPAPRGMDRFPVAYDGNVVVVDTGTLVAGPPIGTNTTGQEAEGPHCIERPNH
jgi:cytochrome b6-f complex iron-sulfur subunit